RCQIHHVRAHRGAVPPTFADAIPLAAHQKAADYTVDKARVGVLDLAIGTAALLALTLGGIINWLHVQWTRVFHPAALWHGVALIGSVLVLLAAIDLPLALYRTFVVEQRYG